MSINDLERRVRWLELERRVRRLEAERERNEAGGCLLVACAVAAFLLDWWLGSPILNAVLRSWGAS